MYILICFRARDSPLSCLIEARTMAYRSVANNPANNPDNNPKAIASPSRNVKTPEAPTNATAQ